MRNFIGKWVSRDEFFDVEKYFHLGKEKNIQEEYFFMKYFLKNNNEFDEVYISEKNSADDKKGVDAKLKYCGKEFVLQLTKAVSKEELKAYNFARKNIPGIPFQLGSDQAIEKSEDGEYIRKKSETLDKEEDIIERIVEIIFKRIKAKNNNACDYLIIGFVDLVMGMLDNPFFLNKMKNKCNNLSESIKEKIFLVCSWNNGSCKSLSDICA